MLTPSPPRCAPQDDVPVGRITFVLYAAEAPLAAENFRQLSTGEAGMVGMGREGAGRFYTFRGNTFYRIIEGFINQAASHTDSIYGGFFPDDPGGLALRHDAAGLLSVANSGPNTNGGHFSIMLGPAPHLNGQYVVFGRVTSGMAIARRINALANPSKDTEPLGKARIEDCGELRPGEAEPEGGGGEGDADAEGEASSPEDALHAEPRDDEGDAGEGDHHRRDHHHQHHQGAGDAGAAAAALPDADAAVDDALDARTYTSDPARR